MVGEGAALGEILRHLERSKDPERMVADLMVGEVAALGEILESWRHLELMERRAMERRAAIKRKL